MRRRCDAKRAFLNQTGLGNYSRDTIRILSSFFQENKYFLYTTEKKNNDLTFLSNRKNIFIIKPQSIFNRTLKSYWRSKGILKDIHSNKINIYHGLSHEIPIGIEKTSIKTIVTIHDLIFIRYPHLFNPIDRKIYFSKFKSSCERANKIIAVSQQTKKDIINFFNIPEEKISVVYQGCNPVFQKKISQYNKEKTLEKFQLKRNYLLYVGSIEERKNLLTILRTLKNIPNQKLVVLGDGKNYKKKCLHYISENKLAERVIFLSNLSTEDMASIYQSAQIMLYPSIFEGFGIPILEALFSKTPVITSKGGCFIEVGGPATKYINPLSVKEMQKAIIEISNSTEIQKEMSRKGFEFAKKFTDEKIANNLMKVYTNL